MSIEEASDRDLLRLFNERGERLGEYRERIATLESQLARVREVVAQMPEGDACFACRTALDAVAAGDDPAAEWQRLTTGSMVAACNALAADAKPDAIPIPTATPTDITKPEPGRGG